MKNTLNYKNKLTLLSENDFFTMLKSEELKYSKNMILKDINWNILNENDISEKDYFPEYYINPETWEIEEIILIKDKEKAKNFSQKFKETLEEKNNFELLNIKDENISKILEESFILDQDMRKKWAKLDSKIDLNNLKIVVSILEKNMKYLLEKGEKKDFKAIFFIIQHWNLKFQKKYINFFTELSEKGYLKKSELALMIDRILMNEWKPQIYWTQYIKNNKTWELELYKIEDLVKLDENRKSMNLRTIEEQNKLIKN